MPDGILQWFDHDTGRGRVLRRGHEYLVPSGEVAPAARHPGARVHFDVRRSDGEELAVRVRLRTGTRVAPGQRRFGDLAGTRHTGGRGRPLPPPALPVGEDEAPGAPGLAAAVDAPPLQVSASHGVAPEARRYAVEKVERLLGSLHGHVLHAALHLDVAPDPAVERPATARATVDVDGDVLLARARAADVKAAADLLEAHLLHQVERRRRSRRARAVGTPAPGSWRHGTPVQPRPPWLPRPLEEREVVAHASVAEELTPDEAAFDLDALSYAVHLFRDVATGEDAVLARDPDGGYRLTRLLSTGDPGVTAVTVRVAASAPPALSLAEAVERLDASGEPWLFFRDTASDRGHLLHHRHDGHLGLVVPADERGRAAAAEAPVTSVG